MDSLSNIFHAVGRNLFFIITLLMGGGFLYAYMLVLVDPSLNTVAPPDKPHGFWQKRMSLSPTFALHSWA